MEDLRQIYNAIMFYYDSTGQLPCAPTTGEVYTNGASDCLSTTLSPQYISKIPVDPSYGGSGGWGKQYGYYATANPKQFALRAGLEIRSVAKTSNYPSGSSCVTAGLPTCGWYRTCFYDGYNDTSVRPCGPTIVLGEDRL